MMYKVYNDYMFCENLITTYVLQHFVPYTSPVKEMTTLFILWIHDRKDEREESNVLATAIKF